MGLFLQFLRKLRKLSGNKGEELLRLFIHVTRNIQFIDIVHGNSVDKTNLLKNTYPIAAYLTLSILASSFCSFFASQTMKVFVVRERDDGQKRVDKFSNLRRDLKEAKCKFLAECVGNFQPNPGEQ